MKNLYWRKKTFHKKNLQNGKKERIKKVFNTLGHKEPQIHDTDDMIKKTNGTKVKIFIQWNVR